MVLSASLLQTVFGHQYIEGSEAFRLLILSTGFVFIHGAIHNILLAYDRLKIEMLIVAIAAVINVGLNVFVIPRYGRVGAASVTVLTEVLTVSMGLFVLRRIGIRFRLRLVWRPLLASGVMGAVLIIVGGGRELLLCLGIGTVVYIFALAVFRGIPEEVQTYLGGMPRWLAFSAGGLKK